MLLAIPHTPLFPPHYPNNNPIYPYYSYLFPLSNSYFLKFSYCTAILYTSLPTQNPHTSQIPHNTTTPNHIDYTSMSVISYSTINSSIPKLLSFLCHTTIRLCSFPTTTSQIPHLPHNNPQSHHYTLKLYSLTTSPLLPLVQCTTPY